MIKKRPKEKISVYYNSYQCTRRRPSPMKWLLIIAIISLTTLWTANSFAVCKSQPEEFLQSENSVQSSIIYLEVN